MIYALVDPSVTGSRLYEPSVCALVGINEPAAFSMTTTDELNESGRQFTLNASH